MLTVDIDLHADAETWDAGVCASPGGSIFQTTYWGSYLAAYLGARPHYLSIRDGNERVGQLLLFELLRGSEALLDGPKRNLRRFVTPLLQVLTWWEGPILRDPGCRDAVLPVCVRAVQDLAVQTGAIGIEEASLPIAETFSSRDLAWFVDQGYAIRRRATIRIDVRQPLDELWSHLKKDVARTPVRKAQRQGLRLRTVSSRSEVLEFHRLVHAWRRTHGLAPFLPVKYEQMITHLGPHWALFLAEVDGTPVGGIGLWHFNGRAYVFSPVQSALARQRRVYAGDFLYWEMIRWCHEQGFEVLDLSGISVEVTGPKADGIRRFKEKWGGRVVEFPVVTCPLKQLPWVGVGLLRSARRRVRAVLAGSS